MSMQSGHYNLNIEKAVLSTLLFEPGSIDELIGVLTKEDFYLPFHANVYGAMEALFATDMPIDEEFIRQRLVREEKFDEPLFLDVLTSTPLGNLGAYVKELRDLSQRRKLLRLSTEIKKSCEEDLSASELIDLVESKLFKIATDESAKEFKDAPQIMQMTLGYIEAMKARGDSILVGLDTGYAELNKKTAGFGHGDLVIIAARPAMGKTAFALGIAAKTLDHGQGVAIFSLEMGAEQLMLRMLAAKTSIPLQDLRVGNLNDEQLTNLFRACEEYRQKKLFIDDQGSLTIGSLRSKLRKLKAMHPEVSVVIIDYLQLMSGSGTKDRHLEVSEISRGLKLLARELSIPIIALSQLNRSLEARADKRPMLSDIRESGSIEQDADQILFVYRDDVYRAREEKEKEMKAKADGKEYKSNFEEKPEEDAEIIIGKNRNGPTGIIKLIFHKRFTRFANATEIYGDHGFKETKFEEQPITFETIRI